MSHQPIKKLTGASPYRSLISRDWRMLWLAGHLWHIAFFVDILILSWVTWEWTNSPFLVSLVGTCRMLPLGIIGVLAGSQADRFPKKKLLQGAQALNLIATLGFTIALLLGIANIWLVYLVALLTGIAWAVDLPVRRTFIRDLVQDNHILNAIALDSTSLIGMSMIGPWLGGALLAVSSPTGAYLILTVIYIFGLLILRSVQYEETTTNTQDITGSLFHHLKSGLVFSWYSQPLRIVIMGTAVMNLLVLPYILLIPVFATKVFEVGPGLMGLIAGMPGLGAIIGAIVLASFADIKRKDLLFTSGALLMAIMVLIFSLSKSYILALPVLTVAGVGQGLWVTMQMAIPVSIGKENMRGRAMGAVMLAAGLFPIGLVAVGALANVLGPANAVALTTAIGIPMLLLIMSFQFNRKSH